MLNKLFNNQNFCFVIYRIVTTICSQGDVLSLGARLALPGHQLYICKVYLVFGEKLEKMM